jgi:hypothetical protein
VAEVAEGPDRSLKTRDKIFAIAPMMDWTENSKISVCYRGARAKIVQ